MPGWRVMYLLYLGGALGGAIVSLYQNGGCNEDDIELKDTIEIDFTYDYMQITLKRNASSATAERLFHF